MRIRAAVLEQTGGPLNLAELELAPPGPEEVLVRLHASGVCHSDENAIDGTQPTRCPAVLGHEGAGVVEQVGPGVARVRVGDHVALSWAPSCGACAECLRGLPHLCSTVWPAMAEGGLMDGTTRLSRDGEPVYHNSFISSFAEACVVPERSCVPIPPDAPFDVAALVGCAVSTGVGAVWRTAGVRPGDRVAVFGCGGVGLSALLGAVAAGAGMIIAVDTNPSKLDVARSFGATDAVEWQGSPEATAAAVTEASGGGVDYAIEATGRTEAMLAAFLSTRGRGAAVLIGIPRPDAVISLPALSIPRMERRVLGSIYGSTWPERDFTLTLDLYRKGRLPLDRLISHRLPLEEIGRGLRPDAIGRGAARGARSDNRRPGVWAWRGSDMNLDDLDGRIGEGWGGAVPNGCHLNVVLARRGSATAAAATGMWAHPSPGHMPVLVCVGEEKHGVRHYEPVWPPTLMMNKVTALDAWLEQLTWGCAQLGIAQGVLDSVADGLINATHDLIVLVSVWVDGKATDETAVRKAGREAMGKALKTCVNGRDPDAAARLVAGRETVTNPFYSGH